MKIDDLQIFSENISTLRDTSIEVHDGKTSYMIDSMIEAIAFDRVKDDYIRCLGLDEHPKSNDALLLLKSEEFAFIEFKDGRIDKKDRFELKQKILDSNLIFTDIINNGISFMRKKVDYYLVYNDTKNPEEPPIIQIGNMIAKKAKTHIIRFNLERFQGFCFRNVFTISKTEFESSSLKTLSSVVVTRSI